MQVRGHGNGIAIALAALAVVLAGTGTAVAVTTQVVNIADPHDPSQVARVDSTGRLRTSQPGSTINFANFVPVQGFSAYDVVTSPTRATLDLTRVAILDPEQNVSYADTDFEEALLRISVGSDGTCTDSDATTTEYSYDHTAVGAEVQDTYPAPLVIAPQGSKKYCLGFYALSADGTLPGNYYQPFVQVTGYVGSGTYTGAGTNPSNAGGLRLVSPAHPRGVLVAPGKAAPGKAAAGGR